ncbi:MAG: hypothetical protein ACI841_000324 [Planctomycetota bacterium]|jgi:hypothetical protein
MYCGCRLGADGRVGPCKLEGLEYSSEPCYLTRSNKVQLERNDPRSRAMTLTYSFNSTIRASWNLQQPT